jgi:hypothetical protein
VGRELKLVREWEQLQNLGTARDFVAQILQEKEEKRCLILITLWFLWSKRNSIWEEGRRRPAETIARAIRMYAEEMEAPKSPRLKAAAARTVRWARPPDWVLKLHCDASFLPGEGCGVFFDSR